MLTKFTVLYFVVYWSILRHLIIEDRKIVRQIRDKKFDQAYELACKMRVAQIKANLN